MDEDHCRHNAVRRPDGAGWFAATTGCPTFQVERSGDDVVGLALLTPAGDWVETRF